jgi:hypothetical protein
LQEELMIGEKEITPKKHRRLKVSNILIIMLLICIVAFAFFRLSLKSKLQARIDAIRAAGYPVTCAELDEWYKIPPNVENAAYTLTDAFSHYKKWDKEKAKPLPVVGKAKLPPRTEPLPEEMKALIEQYIADNNEALELLHVGAAIEHCRYPIDLSAGFETKLSPLSDIRAGVFLLKLEAILHAENGDGESAIRSVKSCFGIARSLAKEPATVSQLVHSACQNLAATTIEYCINRIEFTDEQLAELIDYIQNSKRITDISCAFVGERCNGISFLESPGSVDPDLMGGVPFRPILALYKAIGMADSDAVIYLDLMDEYIKLSKIPLHERQEAAKAVEARFQSTSRVHVLLYVITPALSRITTIGTRNIAQLLNARIALAIERYRLATGKLPAALGNLVPDYLNAVPKDPFDGNHLRYKKLNPGFVVYSIGEDLIDDGGKEKPTGKKKKGESWDVTFIIER